MKKWLIIIVVLAAGGAGYYYWSKNAKDKPVSQSPARPTTASVESRSIQFVLNAAGDIGPADQVSVRPEINGRISILPVDIGDKVKKGELLFALDDQDLQTEKASRLTDIGAVHDLRNVRRKHGPGCGIGEQIAEGGAHGRVRA